MVSSGCILLTVGSELKAAWLRVDRLKAKGDSRQGSNRALGPVAG